ncbi:MAG TPA: response regulator [Longimicrobiaceae bacterium]|nr:response regulator [Longimicrobiaceae bacterium]
MASTILLVEDNDDNRLIYRIILEHHGFVVVEACDGLEAVDRATCVRPALILMDISIPVLDGLEVTRRLKLDARTAGIPVVALTAHALGTVRAEAAEAGCAGFLLKPVAPHRVVEEVRRFISAVPPSPSLATT